MVHTCKDTPNSFVIVEALPGINLDVACWIVGQVDNQSINGLSQ